LYEDPYKIKNVWPSLKLFHCLFTAGCKVEEHRVVGEPGQHEHTHQQEASVSHQLRAVKETGTGEGGEGE